MNTIILKKGIKREVTLEGLMTSGWLETGLRTLDFMCCEDVEAEPFKGDFHVQGCATATSICSRSRSG